MKKNNILYSHIYFGISVISLIFIFFANINSLFNIAYLPMTPNEFGGKTTFFFVYTVIVTAIYITSILKKRLPIYIGISLLILFEIFNFFFIIFSSRNVSQFISSLFNINGNFFVVFKFSVIILLFIFAFIIFSAKNKYLKISLRIVSLILPIIFLIFEFVRLSGMDIADTINFTDKLSSSLIFDFLRFTPIAALSFLPREK